MTKQRIKNKYKGFYAEFVKYRGSIHGVLRLIKENTKKNHHNTCKMLQEIYIENWKAKHISICKYGK